GVEAGRRHHLGSLGLGKEGIPDASAALITHPRLPLFFPLGLRMMGADGGILHSESRWNEEAWACLQNKARCIIRPFSCKTTAKCPLRSQICHRIGNAKATGKWIGENQ